MLTESGNGKVNRAFGMIEEIFCIVITALINKNFV